jgi:glutamate/tyrosine decarboxylase-like PLP-dependent enzyme
LKLFMALAERGEAGYVEMIEHQTRMGDVLRAELMASGWRIVNETPLPLVCFTRDGLATTEFLEALRKEQVAWMTEARIGGEAVVRACITSYRTTEDDIHRVVSEMNGIAERQVESSGASERDRLACTSYGERKP